MSAALLGPRGTTHDLLPMLDHVKVKIRDGQIMVLGYEDHGFGKTRRLVPQAWWCRPLAEQLFKEQGPAQKSPAGSAEMGQL